MYRVLYWLLENLLDDIPKSKKALEMEKVDVRATSIRLNEQVRSVQRSNGACCAELIILPWAINWLRCDLLPSARTHAPSHPPSSPPSFPINIHHSPSLPVVKMGRKRKIAKPDPRQTKITSYLTPPNEMADRLCALLSPADASNSATLNHPIIPHHDSGNITLHTPNDTGRSETKGGRIITVLSETEV
jgi:hypothetical protein